MTFIVYVTSGSYSDFGVSSHLLGDADPKPLIDDFVKQSSDSLWQTKDEMEGYDYVLMPGGNGFESRRIPQEIYRLRDSIRSECVDELKKHGFREVETFELWLG